MAPEERMKQTEGSHKAVTAAGGGKMAVGVRSIVTSLVAFFILASSVVFLLDRQAGLQEEPAIRAGGGGGDEECSWSRGRWVYDNVSRPLYDGLKCAFIFPEVACDKYGRKDVMYQHWRWQPHGHGCDLPRYVCMYVRMYVYECREECRFSIALHGTFGMHACRLNLTFWKLTDSMASSCLKS
jgi:hypothetical protein